MYFPYFRGRLYELIALRELVEGGLLSKEIIPIIEPVKLSSTLFKTIECFSQNDRKLALVVNAQVGEFAKLIGREENREYKERFENALNENNVTAVYIFSKQSLNDLKRLAEEDYAKKEIFTVCCNVDNAKFFGELSAKLKIRYNLISESLRRKISVNKVLLMDRFGKKSRNSDYAEDIDESFSEDHLFYKDEGYEGFADYSIIGSSYDESGFAPFAVAIHIVYFAEDKSLRVRHFVSDSNSDIQDPAGKFGEAVEKLVSWKEGECLKTKAMEEFRLMHKSSIYPGLGTVKKLSIMHHMELISKYLDGEI